MKKHYFLFLALALFVHNVHGVDETMVSNYGWVRLISFTATNVVLKRPSDRRNIWMLGTGIEHRTISSDEEVTIPLDNEVRFSNRYSSIIYTPIVLANQQKGFRLAHLSENRRGGYDASVRYVALSDPPIWVDESEVVMIWKDGKLRTLGEYHTIVQRENEEREAQEKFNARFFKAIEERYEDEADRLAFFNELNAMGSREAIIAYLDELENQQGEPSTPNPASRAWLWLLALPAAVGVWFVVRLWRRKN